MGPFLPPEAEMTPPRNTSHLSDSSANNPKRYDFKKECIWCGDLFDRDLSDSLQPDLFCDLHCEMEYSYTQ